MTQRPKISIVTPSLNQARFLEGAIVSVLSQGYPALEYILIDGGSTDGSMNIVRQYADRLAVVVSEPDGSQAEGLEKGFARASGQLLAWLNADDRLLPGALDTVASAYQQSGGRAVLVGGGRMVDARGRPLFERWPASLGRDAIVEWRQWFMQAAVFFPRAAYRELGGLAKEFDYAFDLDLWIRLSGIAPFHKVDALLAEHTRHADAKTEANRARSFAETRLVQIRHGGERYAVAAIEQLFQSCADMQQARRARLLGRCRQGLAWVRQTLQAGNGL